MDKGFLTRTQLTVFILLLIGMASTPPVQNVSAQQPFIPVEAIDSNAYPLAVPTPSATPTPTAPGGPPLSLTISLLCFCFLLLLIGGVFVLGVIVRTRNRKEHVDDGL